MLNTLIKLSKKNNKHIIIFISLIFIIIFILILIKNPINIPHTLSQPLLNNQNTYIHHSDQIIINLYNTTTKKLRFKLIAQQIQYFSKNKTIQFIQPNIIIFDTKNIAIWKITSNQAILNNKKNILSLQGYIYINNLSKKTYYLSILTNQLKINLTTNDIISNTIIIVHGSYFYSIGKKMHGNLHTQTIQLTDNTQTYYEI